MPEPLRSAWHPSPSARLVLLSTLLLSACEAPTAPPAEGPGPATPALSSSGPPGGKRARLTCDLAFRIPSSQYRIRTVVLPLPKALDDPDATTGLLAYRGWDPSIAEPVRLAACEIPNTAAAIAWTANHLGGNRSPDALKPLRGNGPAAVITIADPRVTVPTIATIDAVTTQVADCLDCRIDESADDIGPEPLVETQPDFYLSPTPDASLQQPVIACEGRTDNAHLSGTLGYTGRINVHGRTTCTSPIMITTWATLQKQSCTLWIFCSWSTNITGAPFTGTTAYVQVVANRTCLSGYWRGRTYHFLRYPPGYFPATGEGWSKSPYITRITCPTLY